MSEAALKALGLVEAVASASTDGLRGMQAASVAGLDKSTASRLLHVLTAHGWLDRDSRTGRYFPGPVMLSVGRATGFSHDVQATVDRAVERLRDQVGETVALHQLTSGQRVCVAGRESREEVRTGLEIGEIRSLDRGATGKTILTFCDQEVRDGILAGLAETERDKVTDQMASVVAKGYLSTESDNTWGVGAVAVPVFDRFSVLGALSIAGPEWRFQAPRRLAALPALFRTARQVTEAFGGSLDHYADWDPTGIGRSA